MNRIDVADFGRAHDAIDLQITFRARRRADADRFIRQLHVQRIDIRFGINRERADAEFLARANDAQRNFAAIGDQNFLKHQLTQAFLLAKPTNGASGKLALHPSNARGKAPGRIAPAFRFRPRLRRSRLLFPP